MTDLERRMLAAITEFLKHFDRCDWKRTNYCEGDWMDHEATVALGNLRAIVLEQK